MVYSEEETTRHLYDKMSANYSNTDIRNIHRIIPDLLEELTGDGAYAYHYNKYTIVMNCLFRFYKDYPHGLDIVHSYSSSVSEQLHTIRIEEYKKRKSIERRSSLCYYCVLS